MTVLAVLGVAVAVLATAQRVRPPSRLPVTSLVPTHRAPTHPAAPALLRLAPVLLAGVTVTLIAGPLPGTATAAAWLTLHRHRARREAGRRRDLVAAAIPDLADLLVAAVAAGLTPREALVLAAEVAPPPTLPALDRLVRSLERGIRFSDALTGLRDDLGDPARPLVTTLLAHDRDGSPVGATLSRLAADARRQRRQRAEAAIRRLPVRLSFPLVTCTLSAFALLTVIPLVVGTLRALQPALP